MKRETDIITAESARITDVEALCHNSQDLIRYARGLAVQHVNIIELMTNYAHGRWIIEEQQNGRDRAQYGARVIDRLSEALTKEFGRGYSRETLKNCRRFYLEYKDRIGQTLFTHFAVEKSQTLFTQFKENPPFILPWSHYLILMRIRMRTSGNSMRSKRQRANGTSASSSASIPLRSTSGFS